MSQPIYATGIKMPSDPYLERGDVVRITQDTGEVWEFVIDDIQPTPHKFPLQVEPHMLYCRMTRVE